VRGKSTLKCKIASKSREPRITPTQYHATGSPYSLSPLNTTLIFIIVMHEKKKWRCYSFISSHLTRLFLDKCFQHSRAGTKGRGRSGIALVKSNRKFVLRDDVMFGAIFATHDTCTCNTAHRHILPSTILPEFSYFFLSQSEFTFFFRFFFRFFFMKPIKDQG